MHHIKRIWIQQRWSICVGILSEKSSSDVASWL